MKLWHISDTHSLHNHLSIPENIDMIVHSGDATNQREPIKNLPELISFLDWYSKIPVKYKLYVPGNHDTSVASYLEDDEVIIEGYKIYGSPWVPTYGDWSFMTARDKIYKKWLGIPRDTDVLVTHGPPQGILDLSENRQNEVELCGDKSLLKAVLNINPKLHCFGHIHDNEYLKNTGTRTILSCDTIFSNGACTKHTDRSFPSYNGNELVLSSSRG
jgi:Icc-related predicted phosphoesterase